MGGVYDLVASGFCGTGALLRSASAALRVWWAGLRCPRPPGRRRQSLQWPLSPEANSCSDGSNRSADRKVGRRTLPFVLPLDGLRCLSLSRHG